MGKKISQSNIRRKNDGRHDIKNRKYNDDNTSGDQSFTPTRESRYSHQKITR